MKRPDYKCMAIAEWVCVYAIEHGGSCPTVREIANHFDIAVVSAQRHVMQLVSWGIADRIDGKLILCGSSYLPPEWYVKAVIS